MLKVVTTTILKRVSEETPDTNRRIGPVFLKDMEAGALHVLTPDENHWRVVHGTLDGFEKCDPVPCDVWINTLMRDQAVFQMVNVPREIYDELPEFTIGWIASRGEISSR